MSESEQQHNDSPLLGERGATTISGTVVSQLAGMAAEEVEGVHMGGSGARTASGVLGSITGSESRTSGITVEVGSTETAIDLKMGIEYNKNILQTVEEVRRRITDRVETITGLRIRELNATITDITFPEKEQGRRLGSGSSTSTRDDSAGTAVDTTATDATPEAQAAPESERETAQVQTAEAETTAADATGRAEGSVEPAEEVRAEDGPPEEAETAEVRTEERPANEASTTTEEPERDDAEVRMRRRAQERARRRRRRDTEDG